MPAVTLAPTLPPPPDSWHRGRVTVTDTGPPRSPASNRTLVPAAAPLTDDRLANSRGAGVRPYWRPAQASDAALTAAPVTDGQSEHPSIGPEGSAVPATATRPGTVPKDPPLGSTIPATAARSKAVPPEIGVPQSSPGLTAGETFE